MELFEQFPNLNNDKIIIRKMAAEDVDALSAITDNEMVYKYISPFLFKKNRAFLATAIKHFGGRDFDKKKLIIAGVYLRNNPNQLIGLAEIFDYKKKDSKVTIGYRINESCWNQGIATNIIRLLIEYLAGEIEIKCIRAFVMPENIYSIKALLKNNFIKDEESALEKNWGGQDAAVVEVYTYKR